MKRSILILGIATTLLVEGASAADLFKLHKARIAVGPEISAIVAQDLNGDGLPEIITADTGRLVDPREQRPAHDQLTFLVAQGDLKYASQPQLQAGFGPYAVVVANIDALKAPDIVVGNFMATRDRDLTLLRNIGKNLFEPNHFSVNDDELHYTKMKDGDGNQVFVTPGITSLVIRDFDGDGYRDVVATGWSSDVLVYFPGVIDDYFGAPTLIEASGGPRDVGAADFDGDGHLDLVVSMYGSHELAFWRGDGAGNFRAHSRIASRGKRPHRIKTADMNNDGRIDVVVSHAHADDSVVIFFGDASFDFSLSQEILLGEDRRAIEHEVRDMVISDLNGDGLQDVALACYTSGQVVVLRNANAKQEFPLSFRRERYTFKTGKPRALCAQDFDADGKLDLAVVLRGTNEIAFLIRK